MKTAQLGSVSSGTMRAEDLIPAFTSALRDLGHRAQALTDIERRSASKKLFDGRDYFESDEAVYDMETLFDMLNLHAPPFAYFGAHPGDGSDYGFWIQDLEDIDSDDLQVVDDLNDVPDGYWGYVAERNDHGNITLWERSRRGKMTEVWSIV